MTHQTFVAALLAGTALPGLLAAQSFPVVMDAPAMTMSDGVLSTLDESSGTISSWGLPNTAAYGQTFTFGSDVAISNVSFEIDDNGGAVSYDLYIYRWNSETSMATGEPLGTGSGETAGVDDLEVVSTAVSGGALEAGEYIIFLQATSNSNSNWGTTGTDVYDGGGFVYQNNSGNTEQFTTAIWDTYYYSYFDLAFELLFGPARKPLDDMAAATVGASQIIVADSRSLIAARTDQSFAARAANLPYTLGTKSASGADTGLKGDVYTWVDVNGFYSNDDSTDRSFRGFGVQVGADMEVAPGLIGGVSLGVDTIATVSGTINHEGDMVFLQPYLGFRNGAWAGEASLILGKGSFDQSDAGLSGEGESRLRAMTLRGSYDMAYAGATVTPSLGLAFGTQTVEGTGGALAGSGEQSVDFSQVSVGARYSRPHASGAYFAGLYADYSDTEAPTETVSELLVDDGWTGRVEFGGQFATGSGHGVDTSVEFGGLGGDLKQVSGGLKVSFRF